VTAGGFFTPAASYLDRFAPLSGDVWRSTTDETPDEVESPYGSATLQYDGHRVPEVRADDERALYYAVGYAHGTDRLFQMDLQRRLMRGQLSAVVGEATLDSDEFHVRMDFARAADANWTALQSRNPEVAGILEAYTAGVNAARDDQRYPLEFELLDYEPAPWTPADAHPAVADIVDADRKFRDAPPRTPPETRSVTATKNCSRGDSTTTARFSATRTPVPSTRSRANSATQAGVRVRRSRTGSRRSSPRTASGRTAGS